MNLSGTRPNPVVKYLVPLALVLLVTGIGIGYSLNTILSEQRQVHVVARGADVMPFDLDKTTHTFERVNDGGCRRLPLTILLMPNRLPSFARILQEETVRFRQGDVSDPAQIHGEDMPGLADLRTGAARIQVEYHELPTGARITYRTDDQTIIHALHQWFDAQLTDHGDHAQPGMQH